jgi:hypothetical protein
MFSVKGFFNEAEIQPVVDALPSLSPSAAVLNVLRELNVGPTRSSGADLLREMNRFMDEARYIYQTNLARLDNAFQFFKGEAKLMPLSTIADKLLHPSLKRKGRFSTPALYAVHMALAMDEGAFRPASHIGQNQSYLYHVTSARDARIIHEVRLLLQRFGESIARYGGDLSDAQLERSGLGQFILKARLAIDGSRASRQWSPYGMLSTSSSPCVPLFNGWTEFDREILHFMHIWVSSSIITSTSRLHCVGASILRLLDRYQDSESLGMSVGWTFLQEIGYIKPWEIQSRYKNCLPGVELERGCGVKRPQSSSPERKLRPDIFANRRKDWASVRVYCIDAESASDIDDGVSIEPTETSGEYWIHVHVADPGSSIPADSPLAREAAVHPLTTYLPGHYAPMFGDDIVRETFSLAPDRRCLTFSARVDDEGALLDYKITPGILRDVMYVTPSVVSTVCGDESKPLSGLQDPFAVGVHSDSTPRQLNRPMAQPEDLNPADINNLQTLRRLAQAVHGRRLEKGAMPIYLPRPTASVSFDKVQVTRSPDGFMRCSGDPYIRVEYGNNNGSSLVNSTMQLAGEVAARWCHERGIPIPYRIQRRSWQNADLLSTFTKEVFYPQLKAGQRPSDDDARVLRALEGGHDISTTPAPHFTMGIDMYTKATSPLRRYGDLLVHWQIEAALLEEELRGSSLVGNTDDSFLPYSRTALEQDIFPVLRVRERHALLLDRVDGNAEWILQALVRAWKFGDGQQPLPRTFRFKVNQIFSKRGFKGKIDWFERSAFMDLEGLAHVNRPANQHLIASDVNTGDVFEVELKHVNVFSKEILVQALRRVETGVQEPSPVPVA